MARSTSANTTDESKRGRQPGDWLVGLISHTDLPGRTSENLNLKREGSRQGECGCVPPRNNIVRETSTLKSWRDVKLLTIWPTRKIAWIGATTFSSKASSTR